MKRFLLISLIAIFCLFSCARERAYIKTVAPPPPRTIVLPAPGQKGAPREFYEVDGHRYYPLPSAQGFVQIGKASWYGEKFQGRPTASGEIFDMYKKSAAHKTLPLPTYVKVKNLSNGNQTIVRVNDRGPFVKERVLDLSYAAARELGLIGPGVADVQIVALGKEVGSVESGSGPKTLVEMQDLRAGDFSVQVGAFQARRNALRLAERLRVLFDHVVILRYIDPNKRIFYRVRVSRSKTLTQAGEIEKRLEDMGFTEAFIVRI